MLYSVDKKVYIYSNNKYYELTLSNGDLAPTNNVIYKLPSDAKLITHSEAIKRLSEKVGSGAFNKNND